MVAWWCNAMVCIDIIKSSQVELYCHPATCGYIQWNETSCLTWPRCYINTDIQQWSKKKNTINLYKTNILTDFDCKYTLYTCYPIRRQKKKNCTNDSNEYCTCAERNIVSQLYQFTPLTLYTFSIKHLSIYDAIHDTSKDRTFIQRTTFILKNKYFVTLSFLVFFSCF